MTNFEMIKSTRHSKITGDFAEHMVSYWLSKHGFECTIADHVGLDIIARNPKNHQLMGISVKSRSRYPKTAGSALNIPIGNLTKIENACEAFNCEPYFSIVIDESDSIIVFILSKATLIEISPPSKEIISWKMHLTDIDCYIRNKQIFTFKFATSTGNWWCERPKGS